MIGRLWRNWTTHNLIAHPLSEVAHLLGLAADFTAPAFGTPRAVCEELIAAGLVWDQLILEHPSAEAPGGRWVHIGLPQLGKPRRQILTAIKRGGKTRYEIGLVRP